VQAAVVVRHGGPEVVRVVELPPPIPRAGEVLVRVRAAAVTSADARIRAARFPRGFGGIGRLVFGIRRPRRPILGSTFAGEVVATGARARRFAIGDRVCGMTGMRLGAHAEFVAVAETRLVAQPAAISAADAAGVLFGGTAALHFLQRLCPIRTGSAVLVNGASGAIGSNAVQLARRSGASVTAVCSEANAALVTELGSSEVVDYRRTDLRTLGPRFDVVFDTVGNLTIAAGRQLLRPGGVLLLAVADLLTMLRARGRVRAGTAPERTEDFAQLLEWAANGQLRVVHDRAFPLAEIAAAHALVDSGRKRGNVIVHP
jgi:NADPH:quinone reductase-like Zn-dependent oxidoreductase